MIFDFDWSLIAQSLLIQWLAKTHIEISMVFQKYCRCSLNASFYEHRNVQFEFLCHTYQLNLKWRTMAKIVYEIFTANFNSPPILISIRCFPMAVIKVFFWTLILAGPSRGQRREQHPISALTAAMSGVYLPFLGNVPTAHQVDCCIVKGLGLLIVRGVPAQIELWSWKRLRPPSPPPSGSILNPLAGV